MKHQQTIENLKPDIYSSAELLEILGNYPAIDLVVESGIASKVARGYYNVGINTSSEHFRLIEKFFPDMVICGNSALFYQELSDFQPPTIDLGSLKSEGFSRDTELFSFHRYSDSRMIGIETKEINGHKVKIFTKERCLFEEAKSGPNTEAFVKAINRYFKSGINFDTIQNLAKSLPHKDIIYAALQTLKELKNIY